MKEKKFLEEDLAKDNIKVEWVFSQGSNKSLEYLNIFLFAVFGKLTDLVVETGGSRFLRWSQPSHA